MFGQRRYASENARINRLLAERGVLISAHRGTATGTITENTLNAARAAVRSGPPLQGRPLVVVLGFPLTAT